MHPVYTQSRLEVKPLARIRQIAEEIGAVPAGDKRRKQTWIDAIIDRQSAIKPAAPEQAEIVFTDELCTPWAIKVEGKITAAFATWAMAYRYCQNRHLVIQDELESHLEEQVQAIAPEPVEIPDSVHIVGDTVFEAIAPISGKYAVSWRVVRGEKVYVISMNYQCSWEVHGREEIFSTLNECVTFLSQQKIKKQEKYMKFQFRERTYSVPLTDAEWFESDQPVELPDGRCVRPETWLEVCPPKLKSVSQCLWAKGSIKAVYSND